VPRTRVHILGYLLFHFADQGRTRAYNFLLVLERGPGMFLGKQIKVGLADEPRRAARESLTLRLAAPQEARRPVFEINAVR
jgi:hypothetical protein